MSMIWWYACVVACACVESQRGTKEYEQHAHGCSGDEHAVVVVMHVLLLSRKTQHSEAEMSNVRSVFPLICMLHFDVFYLYVCTCTNDLTSRL
jgi:hypothetical protein